MYFYLPSNPSPYFSRCLVLISKTGNRRSVRVVALVSATAVILSLAVFFAAPHLYDWWSLFVDVIICAAIICAAIKLPLYYCNFGRRDLLDLLLINILPFSFRCVLAVSGTRP